LFGDETGSLGAGVARLIADFSEATALFSLLSFVLLDGGRLCVTTTEATLGCPMSSTGERRFSLISIVSLTGLTPAYFISAFDLLPRN
jgi:hypothetical protein